MSDNYARMKPIIKKTLKYSFFTGLSLTILGVISLFVLYLVITPRLPSVDTLKDVRLQVPLRVYTKQGDLIAEFGEVKRQPLQYHEFPSLLIQSILAAEDDRFFIHPGVDYKGILRAAFKVLTTGERSQGGSTITMQVARNFFLSREKTYTRKINEIFLAFKIEKVLTKKEILALYLNKIYLGKRAYGYAAAAQVYYGKTLDELNLAQIAMLAGLPKAPSRYNPIANPERATIRRDHILNRMYHDLNFIIEPQYQAAITSVDDAVVHGQSIVVQARYVAEMVRNEMVERFGPETYVDGYSVYTTIDSRLQKIANTALRSALLAYDRRHGYRGIETHSEDVSRYITEVAQDSTAIESNDDRDMFELWDAALEEFSSVGKMQPAVVVSVFEKEVYARTKDGNIAYMSWEQLEWARKYIDDDIRGPAITTATDLLHEGDVIYIYPAKKGCSWLAKKPTVSGAMVSLNPKDGAIESLVGGFNYYQSKFNRVVQAKRQPGSSFKPFIYTAALDKGFTAATMINDAPVVFDAPGLEDTWRPENYSGRFYGPTRLRQALIKSRNLVSIRLLRDIGIGYSSRYLKRFGFKRESIPRDLSLALGSGTISPLELAKAYAVFANGGYQIKPYFIDYIVGSNYQLVSRSSPDTVCIECEEIEEEELPTENVQTVIALHDEVLSQSSSENLDDLDLENDDIISPDQNPEQSIEANPESADQQVIILGIDEEQNDTVDTSEPAIPDEQQVVPEFDYSDLTAEQINEGPYEVVLAKRILTPQVSFLMNTMLRDVVRFGTGRRARVIGRKDLSGKTGTTNDQQDAWFAGFNGDVVTISWVGFDNPKPLGNRETGAKAALPMWIDYMRESLRGKPETPLDQPPGLVSIRIDAKTGLPSNINSETTLFEFFRESHAPTTESYNNQNQKPVDSTTSQPSNITEEIF
ncbi:MAG: penicillin-binding protein 1A [Gammaproteobacteria bacterium]